MRVVRKLPNGDLFGEECGHVFGLPKCGWCDQCKVALSELRLSTGSVERVCGVCGLRVQHMEGETWRVNHYGFHLRDGSLMVGADPIKLGLSRECGKCGRGYKDYYGEGGI